MTRIFLWQATTFHRFAMTATGLTLVIAFFVGTWRRHCERKGLESLWEGAGRSTWTSKGGF